MMKGLGRNVKYLSGILLCIQVFFYLMFFLIFCMLCFLEDGALTTFKEAIPLYMLQLTFTLVLTAIGLAQYYCINMVSFGSARKPAAIGILISEHVFLVLQIVIVIGVSAFVENSVLMKVISFCPLGIIALILLIMGIGLLLVALSLRGHGVLVAVMSFMLVFVFLLVVVIIGSKLSIEMTEELLRPYNNPGVLAVGLAVDLIGSVVYYKTVRKVDLKLA